MRVLERPPVTIAAVVGPGKLIPAAIGDEGWYDVVPGRLYYVHDGASGYRVWATDGSVLVIPVWRAETWATLLEIGASDVEAEKLSR